MKLSKVFLDSSKVLNQELKCGLRVGFVLFMLQINVFKVYKKKEENDEIKEEDLRCHTLPL